MGILGTFPVISVSTVTYVTFHGKILLSVVRIPGIIVILLMAGKTCRGDPCVFSPSVAVRTTGNLVHSFQIKLIMNKYRSLPALNIDMASLTLRGKSCCHMIWIAGPCIVITVAAVTLGSRPNKSPLFMALETVQNPVSAFQLVCRNIQVIPFVGCNILPVEGVMAITAVTA